MSGVLSDQDRFTVELINFHIISFTIGILGIVGNIINLIVFWKQGFHSTVNIAFFALAFSDLGCLITIVWFSICTNPFLLSSIIPWVPLDVGLLSGSWPLFTFCRITSYITIYITVERYLSIAFPLKIKQMITAKRTTLILLLIYLVNISVLLPVYAASYIDWRFVKEENKTLIGYILYSDRGDLYATEHILHSLLCMVSFVGVTISTGALVIKFKKSSQLRKDLAPNSTAQNNKGQKMKLIILIACVLIVCYIPATLVGLATFIVGREFDVYGRLINTSVACWSIAYSFQTINSSINILLYYNMSSNYKRIFHDLIVTKLNA